MFGGGGMGGMFKQAQKIQREMTRLQQELAERVVEGIAGGGTVTAKVNGKQEVVEVKIAPEAVDPDDVEMLEDLVLAAVNQGLEKSRALAQQEMARITGGMLPPGLLG